jgi:hypothetical protein
MNDEIQFKIPQGRYQVNGVDVGMIENVECVVVQKQYLDELKRKYAWLIRHAWICAAISKAKAAELLGCSLIDFDEKISQANEELENG